uniref:Uncharacterized protein n=1 Tax=Anopheles maculatus TaxID=74869 RepID=A0A182SK91_9DIPT
MLSRIGGGHQVQQQQQPTSAPPSPPAITMAGSHHNRVPHEVDDLDEYLSEYKLQAPIEPITHYAGKWQTVATLGSKIAKPSHGDTVHCAIRGCSMYAKQMFGGRYRAPTIFQSQDRFVSVPSTSGTS